MCFAKEKPEKSTSFFFFVLEFESSGIVARPSWFWIKLVKQSGVNGKMDHHVL